MKTKTKETNNHDYHSVIIVLFNLPQKKTMSPFLFLFLTTVISSLLITTNSQTEEPPEGTGVDCYESCNYKSGSCNTGCGARNGLGVIGGIYKCCRLGWNPSGDCGLSEGCLNRHCCVLGGKILTESNGIGIPDPTCATGVLNSDKIVCSPASCLVSDAQINCVDRTGGDACCAHKMLQTTHSCDAGAPPCIINNVQLSKQILSCPALIDSSTIESTDSIDSSTQPSFELTNSKLLNYMNSTETEQRSMDFGLYDGAVFVDDSSNGGNSDVIDLSRPTSSVLLRDSFQPDIVTGNGFSVCLWFKATKPLDKNGAEYNPLASKWVEGKGWELRVDHNSKVVFVVGTESGPIFKIGARIKNSDLNSIEGRKQWNHACGIYYGSKSQISVLVNGGDLASFSLPIGTAKYSPVTTVRENMLGRNLGNPRKKFSGLIAGFKIWGNRAISPIEMAHIGGACGSGSTTETSGVAVGAPAVVYGVSKVSTSSATDSSEDTCLQTTVNTEYDKLNGKEEGVYIQIDLGKEVLVRAISLVVDPVKTLSGVDVYVGNTGTTKDSACFLDADVKSSKNSLM